MRFVTNVREEQTTQAFFIPGLYLLYHIAFSVSSDFVYVLPHFLSSPTSKFELLSVSHPLLHSSYDFLDSNDPYFPAWITGMGLFALGLWFFAYGLSKLKVAKVFP